MEPRDLFAGAAVAVALVSLGLSLWTRWKSSIAARRPILVFVYLAPQGWRIDNIGNGPALNITVAQREDGKDWKVPYRLPPLRPESGMPLKWLRHENVRWLGANYTDYSGRWYGSSCCDDLSEVHEKQVLRSWPDGEINRHYDA